MCRCVRVEAGWPSEVPPARLRVKIKLGLCIAQAAALDPGGQRRCQKQMHRSIIHVCSTAAARHAHQGFG